VALQDDKSIGRGNPAAALRDVLPAFRPEDAAKRLGDIVAATTGLILFSPLLLLASIAIKLDSRGPILIRETCYGDKNRPIQVPRFRLVAPDDRNASRLTRVGRILSQTGIDELPGLVNVLRGELSIVGPPPFRRPRVSPNRAKPGMIRWAQIVATKEQRPGADQH
jgi:lipopolysaccharide/colanic/teichoic acid biosynthesis glycosyltransferase